MIRMPRAPILIGIFSDIASFLTQTQILHFIQFVNRLQTRVVRDQTPEDCCGRRGKRKYFLLI